MYTQILQEAGLTLAEAKTYEAMIALDKATPSEIAKKAGITRVNAYQILPKLESLGLVYQTENIKQVEYSVSDPELLLELINNQESDLNDASQMFDKVLKQLDKKTNLSQKKPVIRYFHGLEGIKEAYMTMIEDGPEKMQYGILNRSNDANFIDWLEGTYIKTKVEKGIKSKVIVTNESSAHKMIEQNSTENRSTKLISADEYPSGSYILIRGDRVMFVSRPKDDLQKAAIVVDHPLIAKDVKAIFDLLWE